MKRLQKEKKKCFIALVFDLCTFEECELLTIAVYGENSHFLIIEKSTSDIFPKLPTCLEEISYHMINKSKHVLIGKTNEPWPSSENQCEYLQAYMGLHRTRIVHSWSHQWYIGAIQWLRYALFENHHSHVYTLACSSSLTEQLPRWSCHQHWLITLKGGEVNERVQKLLQ